MRRASFHAGHPDIAASMCTMSNVLKELGGFGDALDYGKKALKMLRETFANDHPDIVDALCNVADCFCKLGRYDDALASCQEALDLLRSSFHHLRPTIGVALGAIVGSIIFRLRLGDLSLCRDRTADASDAFKEAMLLCAAPECTSPGRLGVGLMHCARCNLVAYCSRACQTSHWKVHKVVCRASHCGVPSLEQMTRNQT